MKRFTQTNGQDSYLTRKQIDYILEDSDERLLSDFVDSLDGDQTDDYLNIYAHLLLETIAEKECDVLQDAQNYIIEFYSFEELYNQSYWYPSERFTAEDHGYLEDGDYDQIDYDKWDWDEAMLLDYIVDSDWTHCNADYGSIEVDGKPVYFDKKHVNKRDSVAAWLIEEHDRIVEKARALYLASRLSTELEDSHSPHTKKIAKI